MISSRFDSHFQAFRMIYAWWRHQSFTPHSSHSNRIETLGFPFISFVFCWFNKWSGLFDLIVCYSYLFSLFASLQSRLLNYNKKKNHGEKESQMQYKHNIKWDSKTAMWFVFVSIRRVHSLFTKWKCVAVVYNRFDVVLCIRLLHWPLFDLTVAERGNSKMNAI